MHSIAEIGTNVPAFLGKLWKMVEDPVTNDLIAWSSAGTSFVIKDEIRFARELLPMYYKHNNMASFIRQLNMYGFHKIVSSESGSMKLDANDEIKFTHPFFMRGHPYLMENIKRKIGVTKTELGEKGPQVINKVLTDVRQMKGRQENMESRLTAMKLENGALWRELSVLRQKHIKQQQIVNKLIQFLVTIVQQNHSSFSVNRKFPRMLQHRIQSPKDHHDSAKEDDKSSTNSPLGPVIHELDPAEALLETVVEEANDESPTNVTDYFLSRTTENPADVLDMEEHESVEVSEVDPSVETIIGMPQDTLNFPGAMSQQRQNVTRKTTSKPARLILPKRTKTEDSKPKYIRMIIKKPNGEDIIQHIRQTQLPTQNTQDIKNLQQQLYQSNTQQLPQNNLLRGQKLQFQRNQQLIQKNNKQKKNQVKQLKTNEQLQIQSNQQNLLKSQQQLQKNLSQQLVQIEPMEVLQDNQQQLLLQELQQVQPPSEPVITIPFDSGTSENLGETVVAVEVPEPVVEYGGDSNAETVIGMPEDSLIVLHAKGQQQNNILSGSNNSSVLSLSKRPKTEASLRPKYLKTNVQKPQRSNGVVQRTEQNQLSSLKTQNIKNRKQQLHINLPVKRNTQQLRGNEVQLDKNQLQKNQVLEMQTNQRQQLQNNHQLQVQTNQLVKSQQQLKTNVSHQLVKMEPVHRLKNNQQQLLLQELQQVQPPSEPVITIPFDSGTSQDVMTEVDTTGIQSYVEDGSEGLSLPVIVESPATSSPVMCSSQDMLVTSPMVINDQVLTPLSDSVHVTSATSSPNTNEMQVACVDESNQISRSAPHALSELDNHIDNVQSDLDNLRELLRSEGISLDANTLLGYFNDDPLSYNISDHVSSEEPKENSGNELMTYNPSLFDLTDLIGNEWSLPPSPGDVQLDDTFSEVNTPQFVPQSPSFPTPAKKRKK